MKDIAVPHGTPARHLIQINRLNTVWRPKKGNVRKHLCLLTVLRREMLCSCSLLLAQTLHAHYPQISIFHPFPWKMLTFMIAFNDLARGLSSGQTCVHNLDKHVYMLFPNKNPKQKFPPWRLLHLILWG